MPKRIYVGNLPSSATEKDIAKLMAQFGTVESVSLDRRRGSAMVEMSSGADKALRAGGRLRIAGKSLNVNEA